MIFCSGSRIVILFPAEFLALGSVLIKSVCFKYWIYENKAGLYAHIDRL